ncbi:MAG TPA: triose-phosphate isomerase [Gemmatimonadales bacterium]|nr:triose-phosphate isomerase [Gemmatimonadales bacterium]
MTDIRPLIYAANWKMHHGPADAREFIRRFRELTRPVDGRRLWFFPPAVSIAAVCEAVEGRADITVGAQNVHWDPKGAFTGELSLPLVMEAGARCVLVGHSERRHLFGETDEQVGRKATAALKAGLTPLVCLGETLAEREAGRTEHVVVRQVDAVVERVPAAAWPGVVMAYEPVWAIGTGRTATPDDAAQVHHLIRFELTRRGVATRVPILYGGSVNPGNVLHLLAREELDGVLVGGASLAADSWAELVGLGA